VGTACVAIAKKPMEHAIQKHIIPTAAMKAGAMELIVPRQHCVKPVCVHRRRQMLVSTRINAEVDANDQLGKVQTACKDSHETMHNVIVAE